jgi:hypothetical protein
MPIDTAEFSRGLDDGFGPAPSAQIMNMSGPNPPEGFNHNAVGNTDNGHQSDSVSHPNFPKSAGLSDWAKNTVNGWVDKGENWLANTGVAKDMRTKMTQKTLDELPGNLMNWAGQHKGMLLGGAGALVGGGLLLHHLFGNQTQAPQPAPQTAQPGIPRRQFAFDKGTDLAPVTA